MLGSKRIKRLRGWPSILLFLAGGTACLHSQEAPWQVVPDPLLSLATRLSSQEVGAFRGYSEPEVGEAPHYYEKKLVAGFALGIRDGKVFSLDIRGEETFDGDGNKVSTVEVALLEESIFSPTGFKRTILDSEVPLSEIEQELLVDEDSQMFGILDPYRWLSSSYQIESPFFTNVYLLDRIDSDWLLQELESSGPLVEGDGEASLIETISGGSTPGSEATLRVEQQDLVFSANWTPEGCVGRVEVVYEVLIREGSESAPGTLKVIPHGNGTEEWVADADGRVEVTGEIFGQAGRWIEFREMRYRPAPGTCAGTGCSTPTEPHVELGSLYFTLGLGGLEPEIGAGYLSLLSESLSPGLAEPGALEYQNPDPSLISVVRRKNASLRQILTPDYLVDVLEAGEGNRAPPSGFRIVIYPAAEKGLFDGTLYQPGGTPQLSYVMDFTDPERTAFRIRQFLYDRPEPNQTWVFTQSDPAGAWTLDRNGMTESRAILSDTLTDPFGSTYSVRVEETLELDEDGDPLQRTRVEFLDREIPGRGGRTQTLPLLKREVRFTEVDASGQGLWATARITDYQYWGESLDPNHPAYLPEGDPRIGRRRLIIEPEGRWVFTDYDAEGRLIRQVSQDRDQPLGAGVNAEQNREVTFAFSSIEDNGLQVMRTEKLRGKIIRRSWEREWKSELWREVHKIEAANLESGPDDVRNRTTRQFFDEKNELLEEIRPDGTYLKRQIFDLPGYQRIETWSGEPNVDTRGVVAGTYTLQHRNAFGNVVLERDSIFNEYATTVVGSRVAHGVDFSGRPTRMDYLDGTSASWIYGCCGLLLSETDREGVTTTYGYDSQKRLISTTRAGITIQEDWAYDADPSDGITGRVLTRTRIGREGTAQVIARETYDLVGRLVASEDAEGRLTRYFREYPAPGLVRERVVYPDGAEQSELRYASGQPISISGNAVSPVEYRQEVVSDTQGGFAIEAVVRREIRPGSRLESPEVVASYRDMLGRIYRIERPAPEGSLVTERRFFNARDQLVRVEDPDGVVTLFEYNGQGAQVVQALDANGNGVVDYDGRDRIVWTETEPWYDPQKGSVLWSTTWLWTTFGADTWEAVQESIVNLATNEQWQVQYGVESYSRVGFDGQGERIELTRSPSGVEQVITYQDGYRHSQRVRNDLGEIFSSQTYSYDGFGRLHSTTDARNGTTVFTYTDNDQLASVTSPDPGDGLGSRTTQYLYDRRGRRITEILPDGRRVETRYTSQGEVAQQWGARTYPVAYAYDAQGRLVSQTTWQDFDFENGVGVGEGTTTQWLYNPAGLLAEKRYQVQGDGAFEPGPTYGYSPGGRLTRRTWARGVTTVLAYNSLGDRVSVTYSDGTPEVTYGYDRQGRQQSLTDAGGTRIHTYKRGVQIGTTHTGSPFPALAGKQVLRSLDPLRRVESLQVIDPLEGIRSTQDFLFAGGRLATVRAHGLSHHYRYHPQSFLLAGINSENPQSGYSLVQARAYSKLNQLLAIETSDNRGENYTFRYTYNPAGQRTRIDREDGSYWNYQYDFLGQITGGAKFQADGQTIPGFAFNYQFDAIGNRISTERPPEEGIPYQHNPLNQVTERTPPGSILIAGSANPQATVEVNNQPPERRQSFYSMLLDRDIPTAHWKSMKVEGRLPEAGSDGKDAVAVEEGFLPLPPDPQVFSYDADGNLLSNGLWTYTWNGENRLVEMTSQLPAGSGLPPRQRLTFAYDAGGRRIAKTVFSWNPETETWEEHAQSVFLYDGWNLIYSVTTEGTENTERGFTWGLDLSGSTQGAGGVRGLLAVHDGEEAALPVYDGNGNVHAYIDAATGQTSATYEYSPFGQTIQSTGPRAEDFPHQFSTKYHDPQTGFLYYGYRYYSPGLGRWLNRDPIGEQGGVNLYGFVGNDGVNGWDVLGLTGGAFLNPNSESLLWSRGSSNVIANLSITAGVGYSASGCVFLGSNGKICISGQITFEQGTCCNDGTRVSFSKGEGKLSLIASLVTNPSFASWGFAPVASVNIGFIGKCPERRKFNVDYSLKVFASVSAGKLNFDYDIRTGDLKVTGEIDFNNTFVLASVGGGGSISVNYFEY